MQLKLKHHFSAAHRLEFHEGLCYNLHGHRWEVEVIIDAELNNEMIIDFGHIKKIINQWDHAVLLKDCDENKGIIQAIDIIQDSDKLWLFDFSPTAENLSKYLRERIMELLIAHQIEYQKVEIKLWESPNAEINI